MQELQGRLLVAHVGERILADVHGDRQQGDVVPSEILARQVAGRVDDESDTHVTVFPGSLPGEATPNAGALHPVSGARTCGNAVPGRKLSPCSKESTSTTRTK